MSDQIAVMRQGVIDQIGDGTTVYDHPQTAFVASFVGENNVFSGRVAEVSGEIATVETQAGRFEARLLKQRRSRPAMKRLCLFAQSPSAWPMGQLMKTA